MNPSLVLIALLLSAPFARADVGQLQEWIDQKGPAATDPVVCVGECPPSLALLRLFTRVPKTVEEADKAGGNCVASLISPDEVLTNAHCLFAAGVVPYLRVSFPAAGGFAPETVRVQAVIQQADLNRDPLLDYAVLKLSRPVARPAQKIALWGVSEGQSLSLFSIEENYTPETDAEVVQLVRRTCPAEFGSRLPSGREDVALSLHGCRVTPGSSGGPILDAAGALTGVVWGGTLNTGSGVNVRCIPGLGREPAHCAQHAGRLAFRQLQNEMVNEVLALRHYVSIRIGVDETEPTVRAYAEPICYDYVPEHEVVIPSATFVMDKLHLDDELPLGSRYAYRREDVTYVLSPSGGALAFSMAMGGVRATPRILAHCH